MARLHVYLIIWKKLSCSIKYGNSKEYFGIQSLPGAQAL